MLEGTSVRKYKRQKIACEFSSRISKNQSLQIKIGKWRLHKKSITQEIEKAKKIMERWKV